MKTLRQAASLAFFDGDQVLLIERAREPAKGLWTLPGGRCENGEPPEDCVRREVMEELGITPLSPVKVTTITPIPGFSLVVFAENWPGGTLRANADEIAGWDWVRFDATGHLLVTDQLSDVLALARAAISR